MSELGFLQADTYDRTLSSGAIHYLNMEAAARRAIEGMLRITKSGGMVYIGDVPDAAKREMAESIRKVSHHALKKVSAEDPDHLYLPKEFFQDIAKKNTAEIKIIDLEEFDLGSYQGALYRYAVYITKK